MIQENKFAPYIHHVAMPVRSLDASRLFYSQVLGLSEIERPGFFRSGAWFALVGDTTLHIIEYAGGSYRDGQPADSWDGHFALRVPSFREALDRLEAAGFSTDLPEDHPRRMLRFSNAGFPQVFFMDPDRHMLEISAAIDDTAA